MAVVIPKLDFQSTASLNTLRDRISQINGIDEVRMDDSWFARLAALTGLVGRVSAMIGVLMVAAVFLVIGNSVRLSIFARRDTINVQKLIGATDGFILRPFLYGGALLGFSGAFLSLILSEILVMRLSSAVTEVAQVFGTKFDLNGLSFDECLLLLLVCSMIGWIAALAGHGATFTSLYSRLIKSWYNLSLQWASVRRERVPVVSSPRVIFMSQDLCKLCTVLH